MDELRDINQERAKQIHEISVQKVSRQNRNNVFKNIGSQRGEAVEAAQSRINNTINSQQKRAHRMQEEQTEKLAEQNKALDQSIPQPKSIVEPRGADSQVDIFG